MFGDPLVGRLSFSSDESPEYTCCLFYGAFNGWNSTSGRLRQLWAGRVGGQVKENSEQTNVKQKNRSFFEHVVKKFRIS